MAVLFTCSDLPYPIAMDTPHCVRPMPCLARTYWCWLRQRCFAAFQLKRAPSKNQRWQANCSDGTLKTPTRASDDERARFLFKHLRTGPRSLLHDREEIGFAFRTTAATLELGSLLDRERHVMYVAVNLR